MKPIFPILSFVTALALTACDSKSDSASDASKSGSASGDSAAGGGGGEGTGGEERKPAKSGPREVKAKPETTTTPSGLKFTVVKTGAGTVHPKATDTVTVHYHGTLLNGTVFDSSVDRGQPASFPLNGVIAGWTEGVQHMVVGDKFKFEIPSDLAYGPSGRPPVIPPNSTLVFEVELLEIK